MVLKQHVIVVGLGFGDEGKGTTVDALSSKEPFDLVVRFNGGQQAGHNVINKGRHHTFTQFGSGFFNEVPSHTSRFCTFDPLSFNREAAGLSVFTDKDPYSIHSVSPQAMVTTPLHVLANHEMEKRTGHGTVGVGFGETVRLSIDTTNYIVASDLQSYSRLEYKMWDLYSILMKQGVLDRRHIYDIGQMTEDLFKFSKPVQLVPDEDVLDLVNKRILFEGAQGVLLDQIYGFHPHTTWSNTTPDNAQHLLRGYDATVVGVTRTYHTRHGAGPLQGEGMFSDAPEELHNRCDGFQGSWRTGGLSLPLLDYALRIVCPDFLSVTHVDVDAPVLSGPRILRALAFSEKGRLEGQQQLGAQILKDPIRVLPSRSAVDEIQLRGNVLLWSDGPNDTDKEWAL